jgi:hypothetical protein
MQLLRIMEDASTLQAEHIKSPHFFILCQQECIVACRTVAMQRLRVGGYTRPVSEQRLRKHVPAATVTHATQETGCSCVVRAEML